LGADHLRHHRTQKQNLHSPFQSPSYFKKILEHI